MDNNGQSSQIPNSDNTQLSLMNFAQRVITPEEYQRNMERLAEIQRMNEIGLQNYAQQEYERVQEGIKAQKRLQQLQQALGRPLVVVPDQNQQNQQTSEAHRSHTTSQSFNTQGSTSQARSASHAPASEAPARQGSNTPIGYRGTPPTYAPSTLHAQPAPASSFSYPQTVNIPPYQAHSGVQAYPSSGYAQWYPAGNQNQTQFTRFSQSAANASVPQPTFVANQGTTSQTGSQKATAPSTTVFSSYASNVASSATRPRATSSGHTAQTPPVARSSHDFRIPDYMKEQWDAWVKNYGEAQAQEMAKRYFEIVQQKAQLSNASDTTNRPSSDNLRGHIPATTVGAQSSSGPGATQAASAAVPHVYAPTVPIRNSASLATATGQSSSGSHTSSVPKIFDIPVVPRPSELASQISAAQQPPAKETHSTGARATPPQNSQPSQLQTAANRLSSRQSTHPYAPHSYPATSQTQGRSYYRPETDYSAPPPPVIAHPPPVRPAPAAKPLFKWNELAPLPTPAKKQETASAPGTSQPTSASAIGRKPTLARDILRAFGVKSVDKSAEAGVGSKRKRSPEPSEAQHSDSPAAKKAAQSTTESASSTPSSVPKTVPIPNLVLPSRPQSTNAPALPTLSRSASSNASVPPSREDPDLTDEDPHAGAPASQEPEPIPIPMANEHPAPGESNLPTFQPHTFLSHGTTFAPTTSNPILFSNIVFPTLAQATRTPSPELHAVITAVDDEDEPMAAQAEPQEEERSSVEESAVEATILPEVIDLTAESPAPEAGSDAPPQAPAPNPDGRTPQPPVDVTLSDDPTVQQPGQLISAAKALARSPAVEVEMSREEASTSAFVPRRQPKNNRAYVLVPPMADYLRRLKNRVAADRPADSRDGGAAGSAHASSEVAELVRVSNSRLRKRICEWNGCRKELNSGNALLAHVRLHGEEEKERASRSYGHHCYWTLCGKTFSSESFSTHLDQHVSGDIYCCYEDCDSHFKHASALLKHERHAHDEDDVRLPAMPFAPDLGDPLPPLPETLPSYMTVTRTVAKEPIDHERHMKLGPWVLWRIFGQVNLDRYIRALSARAEGNRGKSFYSGGRLDEYDFLARMSYSPPDFCDDLVDSAEISHLLHDGLKVDVPVQSEESVAAEAQQQDSRAPTAEQAVVGTPERRGATPMAVVATPQASPFKDANGMFTSMAPPPLFGNAGKGSQDAVDVDDVERLL